MTKEIKDTDLAVFIHHPEGTTYGFNPSECEILNYASYKRPDDCWSQSASVTIKSVIIEAERYEPANDLAISVRDLFKDDVRLHLDQVFKLADRRMLSNNAKLTMSRIDTGEHYELTRDQVVSAIGDLLPLAGKAGLPYVLDAIEKSGLVISAAKPAEVTS